jgi:hypothetical protein
LELDSKYVDVIIGRWQKVTGQGAKLDGTGATFQEVQTQRRRAPEKRPRKAVPKKPPTRGKHIE